MSNTTHSHCSSPSWCCVVPIFSMPLQKCERESLCRVAWRARAHSRVSRGLRLIAFFILRIIDTTTEEQKAEPSPQESFTVITGREPRKS
jgi:hypothetical protein